MVLPVGQHLAVALVRRLCLVHVRDGRLSRPERAGEHERAECESADHVFFFWLPFSMGTSTRLPHSVQEPS